MIFGLETNPLPDNWTPLEAIAVIKCLDEDGHEALQMASTEGLRVWDSVGMLVSAADTQRARAQEGFISDDDDEDDDA